MIKDLPSWIMMRSLNCLLDADNGLSYELGIQDLASP